MIAAAVKALAEQTREATAASAAQLDLLVKAVNALSRRSQENASQGPYPFFLARPRESTVAAPAGQAAAAIRAELDRTSHTGGAGQPAHLAASA